MGKFWDFWLGTDGTTANAVASPWAEPSHLQPAFVLADTLGLPASDLPLDRNAAYQIPAVARSRNLICGSIAPLPLVALNASGVLPSQPTFLYRSNTVENPYLRLLWTLDDLIFHGMSLWVVERGARTSGQAHAPILDARRLERHRWQIANGRVEVQSGPNGAFLPADSEDVILFSGATDGLLTSASGTLRAAAAIENAYISRARNPLPLTVIEHSTGNTDEMEPEEISDLLDAWRTARQSPEGAVGYLPPGLTMSTPGADTAQTLLESARNAVRVDVANHLNLPVSLIDGGVETESMTYRNAQGEVSRLYSDLAFYMDPIAHRLSQDDVVPRGTRVRFDLSAFDTPAPAPTGVPVED